MRVLVRVCLCGVLVRVCLCAFARVACVYVCFECLFKCACNRVLLRPLGVLMRLCVCVCLCAFARVACVLCLCICASVHVYMCLCARFCVAGVFICMCLNLRNQKKKLDVHTYPLDFESCTLLSSRQMMQAQ